MRDFDDGSKLSRLLCFTVVGAFALTIFVSCVGPEIVTPKRDVVDANGQVIAPAGQPITVNDPGTDAAETFGEQATKLLEDPPTSPVGWATAILGLTLGGAAIYRQRREKAARIQAETDAEDAAAEISELIAENAALTEEILENEVDIDEET